jgi:hypothetical protein
MAPTSARGLGLASGTGSRIAVGQWSQGFGAFVSGASSGTIAASIEGVSFVSSGSYSAASSRATQVSMLVKTPVMYADDQRFQARVQLRDSTGRPVIDQTNLAVRILVSGVLIGSGQSVSTTVGCSFTDSAAGLLLCSSSSLGVSSWFSTLSDQPLTATAQVVYASTVTVQSTSSVLTLNQTVASVSLSSEGMLISLNRSPLFGGETLVATVTADTGSFDLSTWGLNINYDSSVLQYASLTLDNTAGFDSPVVNSDTLGVVSMVASAKNGVTVSGNGVSLVTVRFTVVSSIAAGTYVGVTGGTVRDMVNRGGFKYVSNSAGVISDLRGGAQLQGLFIKRDAASVGLYAVARTAETINYAAINRNNGDTTVTMEVYAVKSQFGSSDTTVTSSASCSLAAPTDSEVLTVSSCSTALLSSSHVRGSAGVNIIATLNGQQASLTLRVWFPSAISVIVDDNDLGVLAPSGSGQCASNLFQSSQVWALCDLSAGSSLQVSGVDVTSLVQWTSISSGGSVSISGGSGSSTNRAFIQGVQVGSVRVTIGSSSSAVTVTGADITISSSVVNVIGLDVIVVSGVTLSGVPQQVSADQSQTSAASFTAQATATQQLSGEGASGSVFVYANTADGKRISIGTNSGVTVTSNHLSNLVVQQDSSTQRWTASVAVGAESDCGQLLNATWIMCNQTLGTGNGAVRIALSPAVGVDVSTSASKISRANDPATLSPISFGTSSRLTVTMRFADGSSKDFTSDSRTVYTIVGGADLASMSGNVINSLSAASGFGTVTVNVTFNSNAYNQMFKTVTVDVVVFKTLGLNVFPFPTFSGSSPVSTLRRVQCSLQYQRAVPVVTATLTNGDVFTVTSQSQYFTNDSNTAIVLTSPLLQIAGVNSGAVLVWGVFGGQQSSTASITVSPEQVQVVAASIASFGTSGSLVGIANQTTTTLSVALTFSDGTQYTGGLASAPWIAINDVLSFSSSDSQSASVSSSGVVTLVDNSDGLVVLTASSVVCSGVTTSVSTTASVYCNLDTTRDGDVDLGNTVGPQFNAVTVGQTIDVSVRIRSTASAMLAFQILLTIDTSVVQAVSDACTVGASWQGSFVCTVNNPPNQILLIGSNADSTATGSGIAIATFRLRGVAVGAAVVQGVVQSMTTKNGLLCSSDNICEMVAGSGTLRVSSASKELTTTTTSTTVLHQVQPRWQRQQQQPQHWWSRTAQKSSPSLSSSSSSSKATCSQRMLGDTNADCEFTVADVLFTQLYFVGRTSELGTITTLQRQYMDPTLNGGDPDGVDIQFLLYTLARKWRFLDLYDGSRASNSSLTELVLSVPISNELSVPAVQQTRVKFEIGTTLNRGLAWSLGTNSAATNDGVMVEAIHVGNGVYQARATGPFTSESNVGLVIMIETQDSFGVTGSDARFPFYGTSVYPYNVSGYSFKAFETFNFLAVSKSPTPSVSVTASTSLTASPTASTSISASVSTSPSASSSVSHSTSVTPTTSVSASPSTSVSITPTTSKSSSSSPTVSVTHSVSPTISFTSSVTPSVSITPSVTPSASTCVDCPGWRDDNFDDCSVYRSNHYCFPNGTTAPGWNLALPISAFADRRTGMDAFVACCACGGGVGTTCPGMCVTM